MLESVLKEKIPGRLIVDLLPDALSRLLFLPTSGDKVVTPIKAKDIDAAELLFLNCGLSVESADALRAEVTRNKVASVDISVDEEVPAKCRHLFPSN
jgi:hypothetical protein